MRKGDFVKVHYGVKCPINKQGQIGRIINIEFEGECHAEAEVIFPDMQTVIYQIDCLEKVKPEFEIGKYYKTERNHWFRVTELSADGTIIGVKFHYHEDCSVNISPCTSLNRIFSTCVDITEVSQEEFYEALNRVQINFHSILKTIKK